MSDVRNVIIIGSGPAGLTAAIYTARANLKPVVFEGMEPGGQLTVTTEVENFPGFPEGVTGPQLMDQMRAQAERFGSENRYEYVDSVDLSARPFKVQVADTTWETHTLIIATGATARWLGLEDEEKFRGRGLSACATCDGFFFRDKDIMVVGGGDSAIEEATFLTRFAKSVTIVHRRDKLRASKIMQERAFANEKIQFAWNSTVEKYIGDANGQLAAVILKDTVTGETREVPTEGLFMGIGHTPNTAFLGGQITLDAAGYIVHPDGHPTATNVDGVFACGDVADTRYRQAITAAGNGAQAAIDAEKWLEEHNIAHD